MLLELVVPVWLIAAALIMAYCGQRRARVEGEIASLRERFNLANPGHGLKEPAVPSAPSTAQGEVSSLLATKGAIRVTTLCIGVCVLVTLVDLCWVLSSCLSDRDANEHLRLVHWVNVGMTAGFVLILNIQTLVRARNELQLLHAQTREFGTENGVSRQTHGATKADSGQD